MARCAMRRKILRCKILCKAPHCVANFQKFDLNFEKIQQKVHKSFKFH